MLEHLGFIINPIILTYISVSFPPKIKFLDETLCRYILYTIGFLNREKDLVMLSNKSNLKI